MQDVIKPNNKEHEWRCGAKGEDGVKDGEEPETGRESPEVIKGERVD